MNIRELTLLNYRGHAAPPPFEFAERFTVIAGVNGQGKTALIEGAALLCSRLLPLISPARSGYRKMEPAEVHAGAASAALRMKVNCAGIPLDFGITYDHDEKKLSADNLAKAVRDEVKKAYGDPERSGDAAPLAVYYTTDRAGYRLPRTLPSDVRVGQSAAYFGALVNRTVDFRDLMARLRVAIALADGKTGKNRSYLGSASVKAITKALSTFLDGFGRLRVEESPLRLLIDKGSTTLDLTQLSDGERSFLAVVCDLGRRLALANPELPDPLTGAGVVLIDELELHLHPKWQREVVEKLRTTFPNIQFIATTHSPFVIQSLRPGELISLDPQQISDYADQSIEDIAEDVMDVEIPQKSKRYLDMVAAAEEYFRILRMPPERRGGLEAAERRLNELAEPFSDDPAFQALLNVERALRQDGGDDATG